MDNSVSFKGAFLLKQPTPKLQKEILSVLGCHRQIFNNFTPEGDVLYVTRKGCDKNVAEFLTRHKTGFEYYSTLSTKSGFDVDFPDEAKNILSSCGTKPITKRGQLVEFFKLRQYIPAFSTKHKNNTVELSLKALGFNSENSIISKKNGYSDIKGKNGQLLARISEPGQYGISFAFVFVEPKEQKIVYESPLRYAVRGGEKIFQYTSESGRAQFLKNFNKAVKANKHANV